MRSVLAYFAAGYLFMVLQTALLPHLLPSLLKPDLLLILVIYLGLTERRLRGAFLSYALGYLNDVFAGHFAGLYGLALLIVFLAVRGTSGRVNTESSFLLLFMVFFGTLLEGGILMFSLGFFADAGSSWIIILRDLSAQTAVNLVTAFLFLRGITWLQRRLGALFWIPGLKHIDNRYES